MTGAELIAAERARQIEKEGWSGEHDDRYQHDELLWAAVVYTTPPEKRKMVTRSTASMGMPLDRGDAVWQEPEHWPWDIEWYKPTPEDRVRELVKAGALLAAEIDRLQRSR